MLKVLVAEDNYVVRQGLRSLLRSLPGVQIVAEVPDVPEALEAFYQHEPDVAILDIRMPGGSGLDVLRQIRAHRRPCVVIMYSSCDREIYEARCLQLGADYYFEKGRDHDRLLTVISEL
jgi:DNA-binding NarL/FixJ family response regulator